MLLVDDSDIYYVMSARRTDLFGVKYYKMEAVRKSRTEADTSERRRPEWARRSSSGKFFSAAGLDGQYNLYAFPTVRARYYSYCTNDSEVDRAQLWRYSKYA